MRSLSSRSVSRVLTLLLFVSLLSALALVRVPASAAPVLVPDSIPGRQVLTLAGKPDPNGPRRLRANPGAVKTATFEVTYTGFSTEAQAAFQYAVDIWETKITSSVPIKVNATWTALDPGVLGSAGPATFYRNFTNAPQTNTFYPIAIANKIAGTDIDASVPDINANFSSVFSNWYFGTDGNPPAGMYDFATVVLHELGHGLGFLGSMDVSGGQGSWGLGSTTISPTIYDRFTLDSAMNPLITFYTNPSVSLAGVLQGGTVYFNGPKARAANGNAPVRLYAPNPWNGGSSYSHLDETFNGSASDLMTFSVSPGNAAHDPGPVTLAMFEDMGWTVGSVQPGNNKVYVPMVSKITGAVGGGSLLNGDFESAGGWTESATPSAPLVTTPPNGVAAHGGAKVASLGVVDDADHTISQQIAVPAGSPSLTFWYYINSEDFCGYDFAYVQINGTNIGSANLCSDTASTSWRSSSLSLSAYAGQTVTLSFQAITDNLTPSYFLVDDVAIQ